VGFFISSGAKERVIELYRELFFNEELPQIVKKMILLQIDVKNLIERVEIESKKR